MITSFFQPNYSFKLFFMKKRDLLFGSLLLAAFPLVSQAQDQPTLNPETDPKVLFTQDFEADFDTWAATLVDTIDGLIYYKSDKGTNTAFNPFDTSDEGTQFYAKRDTIIKMYNGVVPSDDPKDANAFLSDQATIVKDAEGDDTRKESLQKFGVDGGQYFFRYISDKKLDNTGDAYTDGVVAEYRRNLFVRGLPIQDNTSYRLTLYLKVQNDTKRAVPTFSADVMRGYFSSDKPFSMGGAGSSTFTYTLEGKKNFTGDWQKVTFMTYYLNDSVAEQFIQNQYYWDSWKWIAKAGDDSVLRIKQPDKYFVRLAFRSDTTIFDVDNIQLSKSWIGGAQHYKNKIRVDFGYKTNLADLAKAAGAETGINAVELTGEYFTVWGRQGEDWYKVPIKSAEYHDDGYMYMWADQYEGVDVDFKELDSVLVTFTNPVDDPKLCLKYTGSTYPNALDTTWVKEGKKVMDFVNETSTLNESLEVWDGVYSMKEQPPFLSESEYEDNSFNLSGDIAQMDFTFSRRIAFDDKGAASDVATLQVTKAGFKEIWTVKAESAEDGDSTYTFVRPAGGEALEGDYEFRFLNLRGENLSTEIQKKYQIRNYSFGPVVMPEGLVAYTDFSKVENFDITTASTPISGFSSFNCASQVTDFGGLYAKGLMFGLYGKEVNARANEETCPKLYYDFTISAQGSYDIIFGETGCQKGSWNDDCREVIYVQDAAGNKVDGASMERGSTGFKPNEGDDIEAVKDDTITTELAPGAYKLVFTMPSEGSWGGGHKGGKILFYIAIVESGKPVVTDLPLAYPYVSKVEGAKGALNGLLAKGVANPDCYAGDVYDAAKLVAEQYADFTDTKPSAYNAAAEALGAATNTLAARYGVVDGFFKAYDAAVDNLTKLADDALTEGIDDFELLKAYQDYENLLAEYEDYACSDSTEDAIKADQKIIEDGIKPVQDRKDLITGFFAAQKYVAGLIEDSAYTNIPQWNGIIDALEESKEVDVIADLDEDLKAATADLYDAGHAYAWYMPLKQVATVRLFALDSVAKALNVDFGSHAADIADQLANAADDDLELAEIYKTAIKTAIYKKLADGEQIDSIDLTGFVRNFNLYTVATGNDVQHYSYAYGEPADRWKVKKGESETVLPGWKATFDGNNTHLGYEGIQWDANTAPADAYLAVDWSSAVKISQDVTGLPAGIYNIGVGLNVCVDAGNNQHKFEVATKEKVYSVAAPTNIGSDTHTRPEAANVFNDSVVITEDTVQFRVNIKSVSSWSMTDNFEVYMIGGAEGVDYQAEYEALKASLDELLNFVDAAAAEGGSVEFYGLDGIQKQSINSGDVIIKVSTSASGKRSIQKVFVR